MTTDSGGAQPKKKLSEASIESKRAWSRSEAGKRSRAEWRRKKREGIPTGGLGWSKGLRGEGTPHWKGEKCEGRKAASNGYVKRHVGGGTYVREHRLVAKRTLERELDPLEVVHHRDRDKLHNEPVNLVVFPTDVEHQTLHQLLEQGIEEFDAIERCRGIWLGHLVRSSP